ncbi:unnamed protein product [Allacma fusca]|uniref:Uncharacterized protein n=1 Tax=Allacma fusca TaxID=39272 RepID=A0A8J2PAH7_9HEXA|nr:unnamed protein product [Allacma fusca]
MYTDDSDGFKPFKPEVNRNLLESLKYTHSSDFKTSGDIALEGSERPIMIESEIRFERHDSRTNYHHCSNTGEDHEDPNVLISIDEMGKSLGTLQKHAKCQEEYRKRQNQKYEDLVEAIPETSRSFFEKRSKVGRPALIEKEPSLHEVIMLLLSHGLQASDCRGLQSLRSSCRTIVL